MYIPYFQTIPKWKLLGVAHSQQDLLPTRLRVRARLARARAGAEGSEVGSWLDHFGSKRQRLRHLDGTQPSIFGIRCHKTIQKDPESGVLQYDPKMSDVIILTHYYIVRINVKSYVFTYFDP